MKFKIKAILLLRSSIELDNNYQCVYGVTNSIFSVTEYFIAIIRHVEIHVNNSNV